jgi:hypothetical protein
VLLASAARGAAEPAEPLTVTRLGNSETDLLISAGSVKVDSRGPAADSFSEAVSKAVRLQQQAIQAQCRSANRGSGPIDVRWAWEARCDYRRY